MRNAHDGAEPQGVDFFISRNKADREWAEWIAWQLEENGYSAIVQDWDFGSGNNFPLKMHEALSISKRTIIVLSPAFLASEYTAPEWAAVFAEDPTGTNQKLIPVRVQPCQPEGLLRAVVWTDLVGKNEAAARAELLKGVSLGRGKPKTAPQFPGVAAPEKPPFPGPTEADHPSRLQVSVPESTRPSTRPAPDHVVLTPEEVARRIGQLRWGAAEDQRWGSTSPTQIAAIVVPENRTLPYIDVLELGESNFQKQLRELALTGNTAILRTDLATETNEARDHIALTQGNNGFGGDKDAAVEVYTDGTIVYRLALHERTTRSSGFGRSVSDGYIIDEQAVQEAISSFVCFADSFYSLRQIDPGTVYLGASLSHIANKYFGQPPSIPLSTFTFPSQQLEDPLHVPDAPLALTIEQRRSTSAPAKTITAHFARRFRLERSYYPVS
jgi:hypothetical protein